MQNVADGFDLKENTVEDFWQKKCHIVNHILCVSSSCIRWWPPTGDRLRRAAATRSSSPSSPSSRPWYGTWCCSSCCSSTTTTTASTCWWARAWCRAWSPFCRNHPSEVNFNSNQFDHFGPCVESLILICIMLYPTKTFVQSYIQRKHETTKQLLHQWGCSLCYIWIINHLAIFWWRSWKSVLVPESTKLFLLEGSIQAGGETRTWVGRLPLELAAGAV